MPKLASYFELGEIFNEYESMIFWQFVNVADCLQIFILVHFEGKF